MKKLPLDNNSYAELNDINQRASIYEYGDHICNLSYKDIFNLNEATKRSYKAHAFERVIQFFNKIISK